MENNYKELPVEIVIVVLIKMITIKIITTCVNNNK